MSHAIGGEIRIDSDEVVLQKARQRIAVLEGQVSAHERASLMDKLALARANSALQTAKAAVPRIGVPYGWECSDDGVNWIDCGCGTTMHRHTRRKPVEAMATVGRQEQVNRWVADGLITPEQAQKYLEPLATKPGLRQHQEAHDQLTRKPLSALQMIQSRKPPEPWIPSVDDFDLLPDAPR